MHKTDWLQTTNPAFRLMIATSWLATDAWREHQEEAIRAAIRAGPEWAEYLCLVDRHRTPALSWAALERVRGIVVPQTTKDDLRKRNDACRVHAIRHCRHLEELLKALNHAAIPVMNLKGPVLSAELYGDVGLRQSNDLDLAVMSSDIGRAQACLEDGGWRLDPSFSALTPRQWKRVRQMEDDLVFFHPHKATELEVHSRIRRDSKELDRARWARSIPTVWQGCSHQAMNTIDQLLYLCSHGGEHAWFRAKWLGDLACIHAGGQADWQAALDYARDTDQEKPLLACLQLLHIVYRLPLPSLEGNPWEKLPAFLIDGPIHALQVSPEPKERSALEAIPDLIYSIRYPREIPSQKPWRETFSEFFYCRQDFRLLRLPDSLFWAYAPLRPVLWLLRKLARIWKS